MDSRKKDLTSLAEKLMSLTDTPTWSTPADLARISFESFVGKDTVGRKLHSSGRLRLTGDGVLNHSASLEHLGALMSRVQRLVTAIGAAENGFKNLRGRLPSGIASKTQLLLNAGARPGSVVLEFEPAMSPEDELYPDRVVPLIADDQEQLVDVSMKKAIALVSSVSALGPDADHSDFLAQVSQLGPRAATALSEVAKSVSTARFDVDIEWREPNHPTYRSRISASDAELLARLVSARDLDSEVDYIRGVIHTISDVSRIHIQTDDQALVAIKPGKLGNDELTKIRHGQRVEVTVDVKITQRAGEEPQPTYTGRSIRVLEE